MARVPHLAPPSVAPPPCLPERVALPIVATSAGLGAAALFLVIRGMEPSPTAIVLGAAATLIAVLGVPLAMTRGVAFVVAFCSGAVLGPTSAPGRIILLGVALSCLALGVALVRTWSARSTQGSGLWRASVIGVAAYLGVLLFASVIGSDADHPALVLVSLVLPAMLSVLVARRFTAEDLRALARGVAGFAVLQVIIATIDLLVHPLPFMGYTSLDGESRLTNQLIAIRLPRPQAMVGHPIIFALLIVVAVGLIWMNSVRLPRAVRGSLLALLAWGLLISGTRSAIVALAVAAIYLAVVTPPSVGRRIRNVLGIGIAAVVLAIVPATAELFVTALTDLGASGSYTHRTGAWAGVLDVIAHRNAFELLVGSGTGSEQSLFRAGFLQQDGLNVIDNQLVTTLVVAGFLGLAILLGLVVWTLVTGSTPVRVTMIILAVMLNSFDLLRWPGPAMLVFLCFGLVDNVAFRRLVATQTAVGSQPGLTGAQSAVVRSLTRPGEGMRVTTVTVSQLSNAASSSAT